MNQQKTILRVSNSNFAILRAMFGRDGPDFALPQTCQIFEDNYRVDFDLRRRPAGNSDGSGDLGEVFFVLQVDF